MKTRLMVLALALGILTAPAVAGPRDDILAGYAAAAKAAEAGFAGFDAGRGKVFYAQQNTISAEATGLCQLPHGLAFEDRQNTGRQGH